MTRLQARLGGGGPAAPPAGRASQDWRQPPQVHRQTTDWTLPENQTPQPGPKFRYGRKPTPPISDTPMLPEQLIRVRAKPPATYYTTEGMPIAADEWTSLPMSPGLIKAIANGDLEQDKSGESERPRPERRARREATQA